MITKAKHLWAFFSSCQVKPSSTGSALMLLLLLLLLLHHYTLSTLVHQKDSPFIPHCTVISSGESRVHVPKTCTHAASDYRQVNRAEAALFR